MCAVCVIVVHTEHCPVCCVDTVCITQQLDLLQGKPGANGILRKLRSSMVQKGVQLIPQLRTQCSMTGRNQCCRPAVFTSIERA